MSKYIYTFSNGKEEIEVEGCNLWDGAKNAGISITRADRLGGRYLQSTPFEQRERGIWAVGQYGGIQHFNVKQRIKRV